MTIQNSLPRALRCVLLSVILCLSACNGADDEHAALVYQPAPAALLELAQANSAANGGRATLLQITHADGSAWQAAAGLANVADGTGAQVSDIVEIGSISKVFLAVTVLRLVEQGELSLDDPLTDWFDEQVLNDLTAGNGRLLYLRHLLNHATGMGDYLNFADDDTVIQYYGTDGLQSYLPQEHVDFTVELTLNPQPGYKTFPHFSLENPFGEDYADYDAIPYSQYSNTGYVMLGMIVEAVTGKPYEEVIREQIIEPLGLKHTAFGTDGTTHADLTGYALGLASTGESPVVMSPTLSWSAGQTLSTIEDLALFTRALFQGDAFDQPETLALWKSDYFKLLNGDIPYGLAVFHYQIPGSSDFYWHSGQTFGSVALMAYDVTQDAVYTAAINNSQYVSFLIQSKSTIEELLPAMAQIAKDATF